MTQDVMENGMEEIDGESPPLVPQLNGGAELDSLTLMNFLPKCMKKRINALKNIQVNCEQLEAKFYEEVSSLLMLNSPPPPP